FKNYLIGFEYIYNQLNQALIEEGVKEIPVKINDAFDVMTMHALETEVSEGPPNRVLKILSPGFKLHDRVVKQVLVIVSKQADKKNSEANLSQENGKQAA
ncbi:MAG: nucleotide exchange factor GrpE, partial [Firmicutes bacterium]|nr:nucleotide exchange factor GrpE [Bacillota bacterium]